MTLTTQGSFDSRVSLAQIFTKAGTYKGQVVALKKYTKRNFDLTSMMKKEMKLVSNTHGPLADSGGGGAGGARPPFEIPKRVFKRDPPKTFAPAALAVAAAPPPPLSTNPGSAPADSTSKSFTERFQEVNLVPPFYITLNSFIFHVSR